MNLMRSKGGVRMLSMIMKIRKRSDYLLRAFPKTRTASAPTNELRAEAILNLHHRAPSDPVAKQKLERINTLLGASIAVVGEV
jgi:hypothetical protein